MLLITAGVLGVLPLSGVVSPFLSSGNTAMLANFLIFAVIASISADGGGEEETATRAGYIRPLQAVLFCAGLILLGFAAKYQVFEDREYLARDAHAFEQDGVKRPQHNPRLNSIAHEIPRGTIYDRNGIPVATSDWAELERHRAEYEALGISIDQACSRFESRHYPFGAALERWSAICARARIFTRPTRRWWSTMPIGNCRATSMPSWRAWCATGTSRATRRWRACWRATATCT